MAAAGPTVMEIDDDGGKSEGLGLYATAAHSSILDTAAAMEDDEIGEDKQRMSAPSLLTERALSPSCILTAPTATVPSRIYL